MVGVVYLSLRGEEVTVPEIVGKDYYESEKEIEDLGLKIKRRATRYSEEKPNTVLEQLPRPGDTVKTGQTILVVLSEANPEGDEAPATIKKTTNANEPESEGTDIAPEVVPDKSAKVNKNANTKKPAQSTRDVISNKSNKNSNTSNSNSGNSNSKSNSSEINKSGDNKNSSTTPVNKPTPSNTPKPEPSKPPAAAKTPTNSGDTRTRKVP
jgi:beta-lactam-binding protein with PASTA domain